MPNQPIVNQMGTGALVALHGPSDEGPGKTGSNYASTICHVRAAADHTKSGFREIVTNLPREKCFHSVKADGALVVRPDSAIVIRPADCPVVVLYEERYGLLVAVHAGRPAMTPTQCRGGYRNVISNALDALVNYTKTRPSSLDLRVFISAAICGRCYQLDQARDLLDPFLRYFDGVGVDEETGGLDLRAIIRYQLVTLGIPIDQIETDGICTYETPELASYRRSQTSDRNSVVAALLQ